MRTCCMLVCGLGIFILLSACSGMQVTTQPVVDVTVPSAAATVAQAPLQPTSTLIPVIPTSGTSQSIERGMVALEQQDYASAIAELTLAYNADTTNSDAAILLAEAYSLYGQDRLQRVPEETDALQEAADSFARGLQVAPEDSPIRKQLEAEQQATQALGEVLATLQQIEQLQADGSSLSVQRQNADMLMIALRQLITLDPALIGPDSLPADQLLAVAQIYEASDDQQPADRDQAQSLCTLLQELWPPDSAEVAAARACVQRMSRSSPSPTAIVIPSATPGIAAPPPQEPTPTPVPPPAWRTYTAAAGPRYPQDSATNQFVSCIGGRVIRTDGTGVASAQGNVNNGDNSFSWITNASGEFIVCGLGASSWSVVLFYVPDAPGLQGGTDVAATAWVNGSAEHRVWVEFREQP